MGRRLVLTAALALGLALLAACGNAPSSGQNVPPSQSTSAPAAASTATMNPTAALAVATSTTEATTAPAAASTSAAAASPEATSTETETAFEPPNCTKGDCTTNGAAITQNLTGDPTSGAKIFANNCAVCHGDQGKGGVTNPGSEDGSVPSLNPADDMFTKSDKTEFAKQLDLFIEHGSHTNGLKSMGAWGDTGALTPQQIADVIAYIISLNQ